jgi:hypothetical protein
MPWYFARPIQAGKKAIAEVIRPETGVACILYKTTLSFRGARATRNLALALLFSNPQD